ncbi:MAG: S-layer homology domain-containing protein [Clostridiales bacterium]|nr:S-layer homology domain-containing protein [Clostridiales bacterium]
MKKRILCFLAAAAATLRLCIAVAAAPGDDVINISADKDEVNGGEKIIVYVDLSEKTAMKGIQLEIGYNKTKFSDCQILGGGIFDDALAMQLKENQRGEIAAAAVYDGVYELSGRICTLTLTANSLASEGETYITVSGIKITDGGGEDTSYDTIKKTVTVHSIIAKETPLPTQPPPAVTALPERSPSPTPKATAAPGGGTGSGAGSGSENTPKPESTPDPKATQSPAPSPGADIKPKYSFEDIKEHWAREDIEELCKAGIVNGINDNEFMPQRAVTRAEFVKLICAMLGLEADNTQTFFDVKETDWYCEYVSAAAKAGIVYGDNGLFRPQSSITREEMALIAKRCADYKNIKADSALSELFSDDGDISAWSREAVYETVRMGIINGIDGAFCPKSSTTRAQAAVVINRIRNIL